MAGYPYNDPFAPVHFPGGGGSSDSAWGQPPPSGYFGGPPGTYGAPPTFAAAPPGSTYGGGDPYGSAYYGGGPPLYGQQQPSPYADPSFASSGPPTTMLGVGSSYGSFTPGLPPATGPIAFDPSSYNPSHAGEPIQFDPSAYAGPYPTAGATPSWIQQPPASSVGAPMTLSFYGDAVPPATNVPSYIPTSGPQSYYGGPQPASGPPPTYQQQAAPPPAYQQQPAVTPAPHQIYGAPPVAPQVTVSQPQAPPPAYQQQAVQVPDNVPSQQQIAQQTVAAKQAEVEEQMQRWKLSQQEAAAEAAKSNTAAASPASGAAAPSTAWATPQGPSAGKPAAAAAPLGADNSGDRTQVPPSLGSRVQAGGPALHRTQTMEMPKRRPKTEEPPAYTFTFEFKTLADFMGELVSTAKQLLLDTGKLVDTLSQGFAGIQGAGGGALKQSLLFTIENLRKMVARLVAMIKHGVQQNIVQNAQAKFLQGGATSVQSFTTTMLNAATDTLANLGEAKEEVVKRKMQQYHTAVTLSVKNLLQAAELLNASTAVEEAEPEVPPPPSERPHAVTAVTHEASADSKLPVARGTVSPGFNLKDYDAKKVAEVQSLYRKALLKKRLRQIVIEYKDSKLSQEQKHRARVLREIVATENSYVQSLYQCIKFFLLPLKEKAKDNRWIMSLEDVTRLFSTIEVIHQFNAEFSQQLDKRMAEWPNATSFGDIFLQMVPMMKMYTTYINDYDNANAVWTKYMTKPEFAEYVAQLRTNSGGRLDLISLLIQPVQRLPRYEMLLKELLKHTPTTHVDYNNLAEAIERIKELNGYVNERKRQMDNRNFILKLQNQIADMPLVLVTPARMFVKFGELTGNSEKLPKKRKSMVFLFNDIVVRARVVKPNEKYSFEESAGLSGTTLGQLQGLNFALKRPEGHWEFFCSSDEEAKQWYSQFKNAIESLQLQELCNGQLERSRVKEKSLHILSATYGDLSDPKQSVEVTQLLQDICDAQGGQLVIAGGVPKSKLPGFVDPTGKSMLSSIFGKYKKQLLIVWSDSKGAHTRTYGDTDPVFIQYA